MGGFWGRPRELEREMEAGYATVGHEDGTRSKWPPGDEAFKEVFVHEHGTVLGHWAGEDATIRGEAGWPGPPVPRSGGTRTGRGAPVSGRPGRRKEA